VVDQQNRNTSPTKLQQPLLHLIPAGGVILWPAIHQRRDVVEDDELDSCIEQLFDLDLMLAPRRIDRYTELLAIERQEAEELGRGRSDV
jgi:hypothetical protein